MCYEPAHAPRSVPGQSLANRDCIPPASLPSLMPHVSRSYSPYPRLQLFAPLTIWPHSVPQHHPYTAINTIMLGLGLNRRRVTTPSQPRPPITNSKVALGSTWQMSPSAITDGFDPDISFADLHVEHVAIMLAIVYIFQ
ncbi:uncharacterized protein BDZ99DRAFT_458963 [Mytilinidion resinicola]|uniref:Uncharacterized protein n=1 Tax=Mytilinidion resinicola TaxID=574789 RepID=A0A6A6Z2V7_9PEZI|nr:uncharacterized protein BDZ99DRAFT_458963 [Mytilinidion resinicola]KAF2815013.1 hypothetical protein BDZ99DRAFT_458963 [Mytilinidion resinicola]